MADLKREGFPLSSSKSSVHPPSGSYRLPEGGFCFMRAAQPDRAISERAPATTELCSDKVLITPSMMCVDPLNFESALRRVEALGADMLHMDVMDGHFVPNAPMGLAVIEAGLASQSQTKA